MLEIAMNTSINNQTVIAPNIKNSRIGFFLLNDLSIISLASAIAPLRMANQLSGKELFSWFLISSDGQSIQASSGIKVQVDTDMKNAPLMQTLIVVGGHNITKHYNKKEEKWLKELSVKNVVLGGICGGTYLLADAGLLDNHDCSVHWKSLALMQETFPKVKFNRRFFSHDNNRLTCTSGGTPTDMLLNMISLQHGRNLSEAISEMLICDRVRSKEDQQQIPLNHLISSTQPKLVVVVELMEANVEEPIGLDELASHIKVTRVQLKRLFKRYLNNTPSRYYLKLRLNKAKQLIKQTTLSVIEVSSACGFISASHFSFRYRKQFGISPIEDRPH
jgi:transcriptional regulator GlxA family with amidase domain